MIHWQSLEPQASQQNQHNGERADGGHGQGSHGSKDAKSRVQDRGRSSNGLGFKLRGGCCH